MFGRVLANEYVKLILKTYLRKFYFILLIAISTVQVSLAQQKADTYKTISAGPQYKKSSFYQWLWGRLSSPLGHPILKFKYFS